MKEWRMKRGLSRYELSILVRHSEKSIERWEQGKCKPSGDAVFTLCDVLGVKWEELCDERE